MKRFLQTLVGALLPFLSALGLSNVVAGTAQTITFPPLEIQSASTTSFSLNATTSSGLAVTYSVVAGGSIASVAGNLVTLSGTTGPVTIKASQSGNGTFNAAPDAYQSFTVATSVQASPWKSIAAGSFGVRSDGTLWAWGNNIDGQLGDGTTNGKALPEQIGTATNWLYVNEGDGNTEAIRTDGTLWSWGYNYYGQLGDGTLTDRHGPVQVGTSTNWKTVATGYGETIAVKTDGTLWDWGNYSPTPAQVGAGTNWQSVSASYSHLMAIKTDGTLWGWGDDSNGELGDGTTTSRFSPSLMIQIGTATNWKAVSVGDSFTIALKTDGTLWAWGINNYDQLGDGTATDKHTPVQIGTDTDWKTISAGEEDTVALKNNGTLWAWGDNQVGELGDGTFTPRNRPEQMGTATDWQMASEGSFWTVAVKVDGSYWVWGGANSSGFLGIPFPGLRPASATLGPLSSFAGGGLDGVAVKSNGTLWAWGGNLNGQLGDGTIIQHTLPEQIGSAANWSSVAAGGANSFAGYCSLAIKTDGTLWAWGGNSDGQLGDGTTTPHTSPEQIGTSTNWKSISVGSDYYSVSAAAVKTDGTLWGWGRNYYGELGDGTTTQRDSPEQIGTATDWKSVSVGGTLTVALKTDGTLWSWGYSQQYTPQQIDPASNWKLVSAGDYNAVAIKVDGTLWTWGDNTYGQLGDGTTTAHQSPEQIGSDTNWLAAVSDLYSTFAVKTDGTLWAWGINSSGQLGDGTTTQHNSPEQIQPGAKWASLPDGGMSGLPLVTTADGTLWALGLNASAQVGGAAIDPTVPERTLPSFSPQALSFPSVNATIGTPVTLAATCDSGLPITYSVSGPATLSGNQLTVTAPGTVNLLAYQAGDTNWGSTGPVSANIAVTGTINAFYATGANVPVTANAFTATGLTLNLTLAFAPTPGTVLTLVNNTGSSAISGALSNLANGGTISTSYNGTTYVFTANYSGGDGNDLTLTLTGISTSYSAWVTQYGLIGTQALPTAVVSPDGITNLMKYAQGLNPFTTYNPGTARLPVVQVQNGGGVNCLSLTFTGVATDVTYTVQASSDLTGAWSNVYTSTLGTAPGTVLVQDSQAVGVSPQRYMRLIVSQ